MKNIVTVLLLLAAALPACQIARKSTRPGTLSTLSWLPGKWNRLHTKPGQTAGESWEKISANEWKGRGVSLKNGVVSFEEQLQMRQKDDGLYYAALVPENKEWVYFKITELDKNHFTCENPAHDFPKKIAYTLKDGGRLEVVISGNGKEMKFEFQREK